MPMPPTGRSSGAWRSPMARVAGRRGRGEHVEVKAVGGGARELKQAFTVRKMESVFSGKIIQYRKRRIWPGLRCGNHVQGIFGNSMKEPWS